MSFKNLKKLAAALCAACTITSSVNVFAENPYSSEYYILDQIASYVSELYIDENLSKEDALKIAISGMLDGDEEALVKSLKSMLEGLDPYSEYMTADEYSSFNSDLNHSFYGIGVIIQKKDDYVTVMGFTDNSPSEAAGVLSGDKISKVDGEYMKGMSIAQVREKILGELGTYVEVTFLRGENEYTAKIKRSEVRGDTVFYEKLKGDIGYITISDMAERTADEFSKKITEMRNTGVRKFILDLRNNGGGYLSSAVDIAKMIVPKGKIIDAEFRGNPEPITYNSELKSKEFEIAVLVNENTASAAEILASAIQDSGAGKLYGVRTFGKGVIQQAFPLMNGSVMKITTGKYITRAGKEINNIGIEPDEYIKNYTVPIDTKEYTSFDYKTKWEEGMSGDGVRAAKERLYLLRYYIGETDSDNYSADAVEAVKDFQEKNGLFPYGVLDITTQVKIENEFAKLEVMHDKQFDTAYQSLGGIIEPEE